MKSVIITLFALIVCVSAHAQCGQLVPNPTTGLQDCIGTGGGSVAGCTSDGSNGLTCQGNLTSGNTGTASGEVDLTGKTSGSTVKVKVSDTTQASTLTPPATSVTGGLGCTTGTLTPGDTLIADSTGQCYVDAGSTPSTPAIVKLAQCTVGASCVSVGGVTGTMGTGTVTFSSIPGTYSSLGIDIISRTTAAVSVNAIEVQFNGDSTVADYSAQTTFHTGTAVGTGASTFDHQYTSSSCSSAGCTMGNIPGTSAPSGFPATYSVTIIGYTTSFLKSYTAIGGFAQSGANDVIGQVRGSWASSSAVTSLMFSESSGTAFAAGSVFTLYGKL